MRQAKSPSTWRGEPGRDAPTLSKDSAGGESFQGSLERGRDEDEAGSHVCRGVCVSGSAQEHWGKARKLAGLPEYVTLDACRHGGMTELGDAVLAEQGVMALSGHRTPQAARLYVKRTEQQRQRAAAERRAWVERNERKSGMEGGSWKWNG